MVKMNLVKNKIKAKLIKATATFMVIVSVAGTCVTPALAAPPTTTTTTTTTATTSTPQKVDNSDIINYLKDKDKKAKESKDKEEKKEKINEVGSIAGNLIVDYTKIDFSSDEAPMEAFKLTLKAANQAFIKNIPYVGGLLSALCSGFLEDEAAVQEDPNTQLLRDLGDKIDELGETFKNCTQKIIDQNDRKEAKDQLNEFEAAAAALKEEYDNKNTGFQTAIEGLDKKYPSYEAAENFFKKIYSVDEYGGSYYKAYVNFVNKILNNRILVKFNDNIFNTYDKLVTTGSEHDETKYLYNEERAALADSVDDIIKTGYSTLKFVMELELANETNIMNVCDGRDYYLEMVQDNNCYESAGITEEALIAERIKLSNEMATHDEKIRSIKNHINTIDGLKDQSDAIIAGMKKSVEEGEQYIQEKMAEVKDEIDVYQYKVKARTINVNGKAVTAYPYFSPNKEQTEVVFKDICGNKLGSMPVKYNKVDFKNLESGKKYTFWFNGAATPILGACGELTYTVSMFYSGSKGVDLLTNKARVPVTGEYSYTYKFVPTSAIAESFARDYYLGAFVENK